MLIGARLHQVRLARGYALEDLASEMGGIVTKQALSKYEQGKAQPSQIVLNTLAAALNVKAATLSSEPSIRFEFHGFRKKARFGEREQEYVKSEVMQALEDRIRLQHLYDKTTRPLPVPHFSIASLEEVEAAAGKLRDEWHLGSAPLANVTSTLEEHRVHVLEVSDKKDFDGLSVTVSDDTQQHIASAVVCCTETAGERQRFSLAHELGHLVLQVGKKLDVEKAAHRFAGAVLAPQAVLLPMTGENRHHMSLNELLILKQTFGMSIQALLYRMRDLNIISSVSYKNWCIKINTQGWKKKEPEELPREEPTWFRRTLLQAVTENWLTKEEAEHMLGKPLEIEEPLTLKQRRAFMRLPLEERRKIMARQSKELADHYEADEEWREVEGGAFLDD
jgi:Zn-dependent peptidase ImmA (M78 family)/transcriptional regulator with XRE-family HTH domain